MMDAKEFDDHYEVGTLEYEVMNCKTFEYRYECLKALLEQKCKKQKAICMKRFLPNETYVGNNIRTMIRTSDLATDK